MTGTRPWQAVLGVALALQLVLGAAPARGQADPQAPAPAPAGKAMTLPAMIELLGARDPRILANEMSARAAYERAAQAKAADLPQAKLTYALGLERSSSMVGGLQAPTTSDHFRGTQLEVEWELFSFGATKARYEEALALAESEEIKYVRAWHLLVVEAVETYINLYRLTQQLQLTRKALLGQTRLLKVMEDRTRAQLTSTTRLNEAMLRAREVIADREDILVQLNEVGKNFRMLTGMEPPDVLEEPRPAELWDLRLRCKSVDEIVREAYVLHPQIRANLKAIEAAQHAIDGARAERLPKINMFARAGTNAALDNSGFSTSSRGNNYQVGVNLVWSIFGMPHGNVIAERAYLKRRNEADNERARREVDRNIRISYDALSAAAQRRLTLEETLKLTDQVLAQREGAFKDQSMNDDGVSGLSMAYQSSARAALGVLNTRMREVVASYTLVESAGYLAEVFPPPRPEAYGPVPVRLYMPQGERLIP